MLEKANMILLSKEASEKDRSLKTQLILSTNSQPEKITGGMFWRNNGFFSDERADLNVEKKNFPKNDVCYINQAFLPNVKGWRGGGGGRISYLLASFQNWSTISRC